MARRAVENFGKAGGAGAVSEGGEGEQETKKPSSMQEQPPVISEADKKVMVGGPGVGEGPVTPTFAFKYGDREFKTQEELTAYLDQTTNEITGLKKRAETRTAPVIPEGTVQQPIPHKPLELLSEKEKKDLAEELLIKPEDALDKFAKIIHDRTSNHLVARYEAQETMKKWWESFYEDNKDLQKYDRVVAMVMQANMNILAPMQLTDARAKLAELTRDHIVSIGGQKPSSEKSPSSKAVVEGAGLEARKPPPQPQDQQPQSLTQALRKRQQARRAAARA